MLNLFCFFIFSGAEGCQNSFVKKQYSVLPMLRSFDNLNFDVLDSKIHTQQSLLFHFFCLMFHFEKQMNEWYTNREAHTCSKPNRLIFYSLMIWEKKNNFFLKHTDGFYSSYDLQLAPWLPAVTSLCLWPSCAWCSSGASQHCRPHRGSIPRGDHHHRLQPKTLSSPPRTTTTNTRSAPTYPTRRLLPAAGPWSAATTTPAWRSRPRASS